MHQMDGKTHDIVMDNIQALKQLFPEAFSEDKVDFESLKLLLGENISNDKEKYSFSWKGKNDAIKLALSQNTGTLRPDFESSKNWDETQNIYIEGDNLEVLRTLQDSYRSEVKMIYIDPPYNTGKDFVYKDDFHDNVSSYREKMGENMKSNPETNGRYHTDWLNMMYPRLKLARNLLKDDGVIFISIDDNEVFNLKKICDEIFGEENFVSIISVELTKTQGMKVKSAQEGGIVKNYEFILCYSKDINKGSKVEQVLYDKGEVFDTHYSYFITKNGNNFNVDSLTNYLLNNKGTNEILRNLGFIKNNTLQLKSIEKALLISEEFKKILFNELSNFIYQETACAISIPNEVKFKLESNKIVEYGNYLLTKSSGGKLRQYINLSKSLNYDDGYNSEYGRVTIRGNLWKGFYSDMMNVAKEGGIEYKNGKKPVRLIKQLAKWYTKHDDIILDFFSGSGTTAHAIMQLNIDDLGKRKFIMVQIPEIINDSIDVYNKDFKYITEIGKERIRRAGKKILEENKDKEGIENLDVGFKVFKLDTTNLKKWETSVEGDTEDEIQKELQMRLQDMTNPVKEDRNQIDMVYEVMLKNGMDLTLPVKELILNGKKVFSVDNNYLIACLEDNIDIETVKEISNLSPNIVVFYDNSFKDDVVKVNAIQNLEKGEVQVRVI